MEGPARVAVEPPANLWVQVDGVAVEDRLKLLALRDGGLDGVEEADELLMAMPLHVPADDGAVEHVQCGEECGGAVALVVVGYRASAALLHRQARLLQSSAWIWLFSSTESTMACAGGST